MVQPRFLTQTEQYFDCFGAICWHFIVWWNPISSIHDMIAIYNPHDLGKKRLECGFLIKNWEPVRIKVRIKDMIILNSNISSNCLLLLAHFLLGSNIGLQGCPMMQYSSQNTCLCFTRLVRTCKRYLMQSLNAEGTIPVFGFSQIKTSKHLSWKMNQVSLLILQDISVQDCPWSWTFQSLYFSIFETSLICGWIFWSLSQRLGHFE